MGYDSGFRNTFLTVPGINMFSDALTEIGQEAVSGCTALRNVTLPDICTVMRAGAFSGCTVIGTFTAYGLQTIEGRLSYRNAILFSMRNIYICTQFRLRSDHNHVHLFSWFCNCFLKSAFETGKSGILKIY